MVGQFGEGSQHLHKLLKVLAEAKVLSDARASKGLRREPDFSSVQEDTEYCGCKVSGNLFAVPLGAPGQLSAGGCGEEEPLTQEGGHPETGGQGLLSGTHEVQGWGVG